jgi:hypothetical protein
MVYRLPLICVFCFTMVFTISETHAQPYTTPSGNDTLRLGSITENGAVYPIVFLDEFILKDRLGSPEDRARRNRLRNDIFIVYPFAITAASIFKDVNENLEKMDRRHDRKKYLKTIDKSLDVAFKEPLKNLSIDQGHVLIKLVNRQTGQNCYSIIKELKGGINAMVWQSVGVFFNNSLTREYDPEGRDKEIETMVKELEASNNYRYQLYMQQALLKKAGNTQPR